jgi:hypothetical protein
MSEIRNGNEIPVSQSQIVGLELGNFIISFAFEIEIRKEFVFRILKLMLQPVDVVTQPRVLLCEDVVLTDSDLKFRLSLDEPDSSLLGKFLEQRLLRDERRGGHGVGADLRRGLWRIGENFIFQHFGDVDL